MAAGAPEHVLAGIDVTRFGIEGVIQLYGPPSSRSTYPDPGAAPGSGQGEYVWELAGSDLKLTTLFYTGEDGKKVESLRAATLSLARAQLLFPLGTGRGAKLQDTARTVRKLYGSRYTKGTVDSRPTLQYCFGDGTLLYVRLDARGRIDEILLLPTAGTPPPPGTGSTSPPRP